MGPPIIGGAYVHPGLVVLIYMSLLRSTQAVLFGSACLSCLFLSSEKSLRISKYVSINLLGFSSA